MLPSLRDAKAGASGHVTDGGHRCETASPQGSRQIDSEAVSVASSVCAGGACLPRSLRRTLRRGCNVTGSRSTPLLRRAMMHSLQQVGQHPLGAPHAKQRPRRGTKGSHTSNCSISLPTPVALRRKESSCFKDVAISGLRDQLETRCVAY